LRIISGSARGRKLATPPPKDNSIRPTADRAREALFNIIGQRVNNSQVLDLFAGTGALGLEALSRGAKRVILVDKGHLALNIIKKNVSLFPVDDPQHKKCIVIKDDLQRPSFLKKLPLDIAPQFDIIFADPPYEQDMSTSILRFIDDHQILKPDGLLIIEERYNISLPKTLNRLELDDQRKYGEACFSFYHVVESDKGINNEETIQSGKIL
jgi:16S rRNA (guanine966-N2)-methyltransferase